MRQYKVSMYMIGNVREIFIQQKEFDMYNSKVSFIAMLFIYTDRMNVFSLSHK